MVQAGFPVVVLAGEAERVVNGGAFACELAEGAVVRLPDGGAVSGHQAHGGAEVVVDVVIHLAAAALVDRVQSC